ncbi:MAG: hypothetical protein WCJ37_02205 [Syntrophus sp. (in: bacteria)]
MQDDEEKRKMLARIEQAIDWLCVPKGENRHMFLAEHDRFQLLKSAMAKIAGLDINTQSKLTVHWLTTVANTLHKKEEAEVLLRNLGKVLYASSKMEQWAEARLINMDMKISPRQMAYEYAYVTNQDKSIAGRYTRDMQRIKARLYKRIVRKKTPERQKGYEVMPQRPRYKMTIRQSEKYNKIKDELTEKKRKQQQKEALGNQS